MTRESLDLQAVNCASMLVMDMHMLINVRDYD